MKLSVLVTVYNHERYVTQALDSILMQETSFPYEIVIGEDGSQDNSRAIVKEYKTRHPDRIVLLLNNRRNTRSTLGIPTGKRNFTNCLQRATGDYLAILEGDDYWTDTRKLEKQVSFLDKHRGNVACFHPVLREYVDDTRPAEVALRHRCGTVYSRDEMLFISGIAPCSLVFRNATLKRFPAWFYQCPSPDKALFCLLAGHGDFAYLDEVMAAYRVHREGAWSGQTARSRIKSSLKTWELIQENLYPTRKSEFQIFRYIHARKSLSLVHKEIRDGYHWEAFLCLCYAVWLGLSSSFSLMCRPTMAGSMTPNLRSRPER
jgi:glycosyltransferase involved in cell wall biosynthesis